MARTLTEGFVSVTVLLQLPFLGMKQQEFSCLGAIDLYQF